MVCTARCVGGYDREVAHCYVRLVEGAGVRSRKAAAYRAAGGRIRIVVCFR
jgi:hypothetical protein